MSNQQKAPTYDEVYKRFHGAKVQQEQSFEILFNECVGLAQRANELSTQIAQLIQEKRSLNKPDEKKTEEKPKARIIEKAKNQ